MALDFPLCPPNKPQPHIRLHLHCYTSLPIVDFLQSLASCDVPLIIAFRHQFNPMISEQNSHESSHLDLRELAAKTSSEAR